MNETQYAGMVILDNGMIMVGNQMTGDTLIRVMCSPYASYMDNNLFGMELCHVADDYIKQHLGGPRMKVNGIVSLTDVTIAAEGPWSRLIMNKRTWQPIGEILLYPAPNSMQPFLFECEVARTVEKYVKSVRSKMKEIGWDTSC